MTDNHKSLYSDAQRYDLVEKPYASGDFLEFYRRQIVRYGEPVLELACGTGRLTIPLRENGVDITGLDISDEMLDFARLKASQRGVTISLINGDIRNFDLGRRFKFIFIAAQSLTHLHTREDIEASLSSVQRHLTDDGRLLIELFNPSMRLLARDTDRRYEIGEYDDPNTTGARVHASEEVSYDAATQINHIRWFFRSGDDENETVLSFEMRQYFPLEIDELLWYNRFLIEHKYGSYDESAFSSDSAKQLIVCQSDALR